MCVSTYLHACVRVYVRACVREYEKAKYDNTKCYDPTKKPHKHEIATLQRHRCISHSVSVPYHKERIIERTS